MSAHLGLSPEGQKMDDKISIADVVQLNSDEVFKAANDAKRDDILSLLNKFMDYNKVFFQLHPFILDELFNKRVDRNK